jgi:hypothetical protein
MEKKSAEWIEATEIKIRDAFDVFAKDGDTIVEVHLV